MRLDDLKAQSRDYKPKTPPSVLKDFLDGSIHEDFIREIAVRLEQMRDFNEECDSKSYLETRGGIKVLRLVADIFHNLHANALEDRAREENPNE